MDGSYYDLRECINDQLNEQGGIRNSFLQFQNVINFLEKGEYILFDQRQAINPETNKPYNVKVKYGENPTDGSEEANFKTTYPMGALTLKGFNYVFDREREKTKHGIYKLTFIVALCGCFASIINCSNNYSQDKLKKDIAFKDSLINLITKENQKLYNEKAGIQFKLDSTIKTIR